MAPPRIHAKSHTPRYVEIEHSLRQRISTLEPHAPLPSDAQLCAEFGVSRMTARAAVQNLVNEGLVYRESGRGSFVAPRTVDRQLANLRGFSAEMTARGRRPASIVLAASMEAATEADRTALGLQPASQVVRIQRIRTADSIPLVLETTALAPICAQVLDTDLSSASLHTALVDLGITPTSGSSTITATAATKAQAQHLDLSPGSPLLVERRIIFDATGRAIESTESCYVPQRYTITSQFTVEPAR